MFLASAIDINPLFGAVLLGINCGIILVHAFVLQKKIFIREIKLIGLKNVDS